jgi:Ca2+-binding EF-hand superfamily protein
VGEAHRHSIQAQDAVDEVRRALEGAGGGGEVIARHAVEAAERHAATNYHFLRDQQTILRVHARRSEEIAHQMQAEQVRVRESNLREQRERDNVASATEAARLDAEERAGQVQADTLAASQMQRDLDNEDAAAAHQVQADQEFAQEQEEAGANLAQQLDAEEEQQNMEFEIEEIPNDDWITQLFNTFDEDENGTIDIHELLGLFINFPYDPSTGERISADEVDYMLQAMQNPDVPITNDAFVIFFNRADTDKSGALDPHEFRNMVINFNPALQDRITAFLTAPLQEPPAAAAASVVQGAIEVVKLNTELGNTTVTFQNLLEHFKKWDFATQRAAIRERLSDSSWAYVTGAVASESCYEIHKSVYFTLGLEQGLTDIETITGRKYVPGNVDTEPDIILNDFYKLLVRGVELHAINPIPNFGPEGGWDMDGLRMLINHLMGISSPYGQHEYEGLKGALLRMQWVGGEQLNLPLNRVMYLINRFLAFVSQPENGRQGELLLMSYVFSYLSLAVGGYSHNIESYIASGGREHTAENMGIITGCGAGNSDRVLLSFRMGLKLGLNKIALESGKEQVVPTDENVRLVLPPIDFPAYVSGQLEEAPNFSSAEYITFGRLVGEHLHSPPHSTENPNTDLAGLKRYLVKSYPVQFDEEQRLEWLTKMAFFLEDPDGNPAWAGHSFIEEQELKGGRLKRRARYTSKRGRRIKKNTTKKAHQVRKNKYIKKKKPKPVNKKTRVKKRGVTSKKSVKSLTSSTKRVRKSRKSRTRKV